MLVLETLDMNRTVEAYNLRKREADILNQESCHRIGLPFTIQATDAQTARGTFERSQEKMPNDGTQGRSSHSPKSVGAGVAELPMLVLETLDMNRTVEAYNLRKREADILNQACHGLPFTIQATDAQTARGTFDHFWIASVLNDPECFPETSALSYGRADPVRFDPVAFQRERTRIQRLLDACLPTLSGPGLLSTTVEEVTWMTDWFTRNQIPFHVEAKRYPTAIVGDPLCFIRIEPA